MARGAFAGLARALRAGRERPPLFLGSVVFVLSFAGLGACLYPCLVPAATAIADSASASDTLVFMLVGIGMLFPVMLVYNGCQHLVLGGHGGRDYAEGAAPDKLSHGAS